MKNIHTTLRLQHHRHTGKLLQHKHTSYHGLAIILGLAGLMIVGLNVLAKVTADELAVYARIPAPVPTTAAVITSPSDGSKFTTANITVLGSCPVVNPHVIITILDNGRSLGSSACGSDNTFAVPITLLQGTNSLVARSTTITEDNGPDSQPVTVSYTLRTTPPSNGGGTQPVSPPSSGAPLQISTDQSFVVYGPAQDAVLNGAIMGGSAPYHVHIDWGDDTTSDYTADTTVQVFRHHYRRTGTYDITMTITDSQGNVLVQHFAAVTPYVPPVGAGSTTTSGSPLKQFLNSVIQWLSNNKLVGFSLTYLGVLAIFAVFWLRRHPFAYAKIPPVRHSVVVTKKRRSAQQSQKTGYNAARKPRSTSRGNR